VKRTTSPSKSHDKIKIIIIPPIIKNNIYSLNFRAPEKDFENEKSNFNITLKSFKII
jgi:hypothetical protein